MAAADAVVLLLSLSSLLEAFRTVQPDDLAAKTDLNNMVHQRINSSTQVSRANSSKKPRAAVIALLGSLQRSLVCE